MHTAFAITRVRENTSRISQLFSTALCRYLASATTAADPPQGLISDTISRTREIREVDVTSTIVDDRSASDVGVGIGGRR